MVIVIDYVAERERKIAELMRALMTCFAKLIIGCVFCLLKEKTPGRQVPGIQNYCRGWTGIKDWKLKRRNIRILSGFRGFG